MTDICLPIDASAGSPSFPAAQHRVALGALMQARTDRPLGALSGVRPGSEPTITATSTTWTVTPFAAIHDPGTALTVGAYLVAFTANKTGAVNAADASNPRIDRLDLQVPDDPSGGTVVPVIVYTAGVAAATPSAPAAPTRSTPLAQITVPKAGTGSPSVTSTFRRTAAAGGVVLCRDSTEYPASPFTSQVLYNQSADVLLVRDGSAWRQYTPTILRTFENAGSFNLASGVETAFNGTAWTASANIGDLGYSAGIVTINTPGWYRWSGTVDWPVGTAADAVQAYVKLNGVAQVPGRDTRNGIASHRPTQNVGATIPTKLSAGDTLQLAAISLDAAVTNVNPYAFTVERVG